MVLALFQHFDTKNRRKPCRLCMKMPHSVNTTVHDNARQCTTRCFCRLFPKKIQTKWVQRATTVYISVLQFARSILERKNENLFAVPTDLGAADCRADVERLRWQWQQ